MERFDIDKTIKILGLDIHVKQADGGRDFDVACKIAVEKMRKCKEYEDAEEQGLLLRLPCKVGDKVYLIREVCDLKGTKIVDEFVVYSFDLRKLQQFVVDYDGHRLNIANFGRTVFLTREEAEQALKQMGE